MFECFVSAYTMAKYGMSMCVLGMAEELKGDGIGVNALWPRTSKKHIQKVKFYFRFFFHYLVKIFIKIKATTTTSLMLFVLY